VKTALIVVDVQNDFAHPEGSLYVNPGEEIVPGINGLMGHAIANDWLVVYTADWHPERTPHFNTEGGPWPPHCIANTWGAQFHRDLFVLGEVVHKGENGEDGYSGFYARNPVTSETVPTRLEAILREVGVERVVVVGIATDVCVTATAMDAKRLGFVTEVDLSYTAAVSEKTLEVAIQEMLDNDIILLGAVPQKVKHYDD
jgi:nicotinamidase/pyrazinamidase